MLASLATVKRGDLADTEDEDEDDDVDDDIDASEGAATITSGMGPAATLFVVVNAFSGSALLRNASLWSER